MSIKTRFFFEGGRRCRSDQIKKIVLVKSKTTIKNGKTQIGFHDGRSLIDETDVNVGDSCILEVPKQKILDVIRLEKNSRVIITRGANVGKIGVINQVKEGTFTLPKRVNILLEKREIEIPANMTMPIGKDKPVIQIR